MTTEQQLKKAIPVIRKALAKMRFATGLWLRPRYMKGLEFITIEVENTNERPDMAGMAVTYYANENIFEVAEFQAGTNENELHVFGEYKTIQAALRRLANGKCTPIKVWK
jgi:hypothetical protein